ncbi:MAG: aspartate/tyrosine/aromatic aminotransferase [Rhodobacteraceae bacterium]|jgi:aromatic-amino-acid transaminase|uniref:amino acid aminotransferase n=1 Tax=Albidovulum sp. TaxID=1872424 RepID=UPI002658091E|nr:amino acid aminotransferase [uncultured Defluviimonas sp.]MCC0071386.1 aspartate/tyrosine/aromatic aminotransferase [Paracoccaceae bacterium]
MFASLKPQPADKILQLIGQFRADPRADKIDLGVGVYKDPSGLTPVMRAVKAAEKRLWETETTKTYTGLAGEPAFNTALARLVLGEATSEDRIAAAAAPGGTGAVRQAFELIRMASPGARVWVSDPTWPNHLSILNYLGMPVRPYRYFDAETRGVAFEAMLADLSGAKAGDAVLLHGCCHNPTGANLTLPEWAEVAAILEKTGALPLIDIAYQGFGDGLEADAAGVRLIADRLPEVLVAASCSKNFGIYRERTGALMALSDPARREVMQGTLAFLNRQNYSFPPDHGARLVTMILEDPALRADWEVELESVRLGMLTLREQLAAELRDLSGSDRFGFLAQHRGMFSRLGASPEQVERLKTEHAIYMVGDSRLNIAGLNAATVPVLARAILSVGI